MLFEPYVRIHIFSSVRVTDWPPIGGVTNSRAEQQQTPSVEKHAHPPRVVYCAIYLTLTLITKFRVSNLHITTC